MHAQNTRGVNGNLNFTGQYSNAAGTTGLGYSDFVTGQTNAFGQGRPFYDNDRSDYYGLYVQDAWRVSSRVSLNLGLRFEPYLPQRNTDNYVESFSMANFLAGKIGTPPVATPALTPPAGLIFSGDPGFPPNQQYNGRAEHFLPRIGIVWDPFGDGKTSVRASYGLLYDSPHMFFYTRVSNNPPWGATLSRTGNFPLSESVVGLSWRRSFCGEHGIGYREVIRFLPLGRRLRRVRPESEESAGQHLESGAPAPVRQVVALGSYIGNKSSHLWAGRELNLEQYIPGTCAKGQYGRTAAGNCSSTATANQAARRTLTLLNPTWGPSYNTIALVDGGSTANYNAMLLSAQHRLSNHFSVLTI